MFRKLALSTVAVFAVAAGVTAAPASHEPPVGTFGPHHHGRYQVFVRHHAHWHLYATYHDREDAYRAARHLERHGHDAKVERVRW